MTIHEQLDRLDQIIQFLDRNVRQAIYLASYFERAAYRGTDVKTYFDQSRSVGGYNQLLDAVYFELVVTMARLYDDPYKNNTADKTASIPVAMTILEDPRMLSELKERLLARHNPTATRGADQSTIQWLKQSTSATIEQRLDAIAPLIVSYKQLKGNHLLQRIRAARNEFMAHTTLNPTTNNKLAYGDAEQLLTKTIPIVASLQSSICSCHISYDHERKESAELADTFWTKMIQQ